MTMTADAAAVLPSTDAYLSVALQEARRIAAAAEASISALLGRAQERVLAATADLPDGARELELRSTAASVAQDLKIADRTALAQMARAHAVLTRYPNVQAAWASGELTGGHVRVIEERGRDLADPEHLALYEEAILELAASTTPGRLAGLADRLVAELLGRDAIEREILARADRRVAIEDLPDGMSLLCATLPRLQAHAIYDRLTEHAIALSAPCGRDECELSRRTRLAGGDARYERDAESFTPEQAQADAEATGTALERAFMCGCAGADGRTFDALRADTLMDLALTADAAQLVERADGGAPRIDAKVSVTIPALSMLDRSSEPADLVGVGPVSLEDAMDLASEVPSLLRILTDPIAKAPIAADRYRPPEQMRRFLAVRDGRCRFPGCRRKPERCDLDHTIDAALGGETAVGNLAHLCRRHHVLKHQTTWAVRQLAGGTLEWTRPDGRIITDRPDLIGPRFEPDDPRTRYGPPDDAATGPTSEPDEAIPPF